MGGHRVIDTTSLQGDIRSTRGGITIGAQRVPLEDVGVLLLGNKVTISGGALTMASKYDVVVLNCNWRAVPDGVFYGWSHNTKVAARHRAQAELSLPRRKQAWQEIVKAKIRGQANNLTEIGAAESKRLNRLVQEVRSGDVNNCEAQAAKLFWGAYFGAETEFHRAPDGSDDTNSLLNYGYTILRGFVIQAICAAGLCPTYALWHHNRGDTFALADDLIEPFRPAVDHCVRSLGTTANLSDPAAKKALVSVVSTPLGKEGATVLTSIYDLASELAMFVEGAVDRLQVPCWYPNPNKAETLDG
jgi:CRISPR-associated protein Cas1